jgi:gliding motility-associated-like protein
VKLIQPKILALLVLTLFLNVKSYTQNNVLVLDGAYIVLDGGTAANSMYVVIDEPSDQGIVRLSGGHIHSENQYHYIKWFNTNGAGNYLFPFGVNAADYIPFTFGKTSAGTNNITVSSWTTDQANFPRPALTNVAAVTSMTGTADAVQRAIDRFWDVQSPNPVVADLTFSYRGIENTTMNPLGQIFAQHWNGAAWDPQVGPGTPGVTLGVGTSGLVMGQTTFSPWVLTICDTTSGVDTVAICQNDSVFIGGAFQTAAGTYVDTLFNANYMGCDSILRTTIIINPLPLNNTNLGICFGDSALLGGSYQTAPGVYIDTLFNASYLGCDSIIFTTLSVKPSIATITNTTNDSVCPNEQTIIYTSPSLGNGGPYTYQWSNGSTDSSTTVSPATTTTYTVIINDGCSTPITDSITIYVRPIPTVSFSANMYEACEEPIEIFEFYNTTGAMSYSASWYFSDGTTLNGDTVSHSFLTAGTYDVTLTVTTSPQTGSCSNSMIQNNYITIHPNPTADFIIGENPLTMLNPITSFTDLSYNNIMNWAWDIGSLDSMFMQNFSYTFPTDTGTYPIYLTVTDDNDCKNTTIQILTVEGDMGLYVPNAFTPDFDNLNDGFAPNGFGISEEGYEFMIFNRWGELIFISDVKFEPWDGTYKGTFVENGVYVWKLNYQDLNGKKHNAIGSVNLIR